VTHVDFTEPYSMTLRKRIAAAAAACGEPIVDGGSTRQPRGRGSNPQPRSIGWSATAQTWSA
jgi:hypothetical protein